MFTWQHNHTVTLINFFQDCYILCPFSMYFICVCVCVCIIMYNVYLVALYNRHSPCYYKRITFSGLIVIAHPEDPRWSSQLSPCYQVFVFHVIILVYIHTVRSYPELFPVSSGLFPQEIFGFPEMKMLGPRAKALLQILKQLKAH